MKKIALAVAAASVLLVGAASAADITVKARRAPIPAPVFSWTGCYVGGNVGYARGDVHSGAAANPIFIASNPAAATAAVLAPSAVGVTPDGFTAGVGVGCNYQTGIFVLSAEGDINHSDLGHSQIRGPFPSGGFAPHTWEENFRSDWFATARARAGAVVAERHLLYVTGGAAFAEYSWLKALGFPGFWSAKVEYLHMDFGSTSATTPTPPGAGPPGTGFIFSHNFREDVVRVGLNYRFGWAGPVVAKY